MRKLKSKKMVLNKLMNWRMFSAVSFDLLASLLFQQHQWQEIFQRWNGLDDHAKIVSFLPSLVHPSLEEKIGEYVAAFE